MAIAAICDSGLSPAPRPNTIAHVENWKYLSTNLISKYDYYESKNKNNSCCCCKSLTSRSTLTSLRMQAIIGLIRNRWSRENTCHLRRTFDNAAVDAMARRKFWLIDVLSTHLINAITAGCSRKITLGPIRFTVEIFAMAGIFRVNICTVISHNTAISLWHIYTYIYSYQFLWLANFIIPNLWYADMRGKIGTRKMETSSENDVRPIA